MRSSHPTYAVDTAFDETNLLPDAGADRIDDLDVLRHGATASVFSKVKVPSTIGSHLRAHTFGHVRHLDAVASRFLLGLGRATGMLDALAAPGATTYVDVDDMIKAMHGYAQEGVAFGYSKVKGLNAQVATLSTPAMAPVIAAARLRRGKVASAHGGAKIVGEAVTVAKAAGAHTVVVRADSAYYEAGLAWVARKAGARFSMTARSTPRGAPRSPASPPTPGWTSSTPTRSGMNRTSGGSLMPRSPRSPRSPLRRVHRTRDGRARHRALDRAPCEAVEPQECSCRSAV